MSSDPVRDEAEHLVAAAIAAVSAAARGLSGGAGRPNLATGDPECCICPVCRVIAVMREPSPELAERLATGAGDLAAGVTSLLRAFTRPRTDSEHGSGRDSGEGDQFWEPLRRQARPGGAGPVDDPWHTATTASASTASATTASATTAPPATRASPATTPPPPTTTAGPTTAPSSSTPSSSTPSSTTAVPPPAKKMAKKVAKKAAKKAAGEQGDQ